VFLPSDKFTGLALFGDGVASRCQNACPLLEMDGMSGEQKIK
jgi:hypothetical protein